MSLPPIHQLEHSLPSEPVSAIVRRYALRIMQEWTARGHPGHNAVLLRSRVGGTANFSTSWRWSAGGRVGEGDGNRCPRPSPLKTPRPATNAAPRSTNAPAAGEGPPVGGRPGGC